MKERNITNTILKVEIKDFHVSLVKIEANPCLLRTRRLNGCKMRGVPPPFAPQPFLRVHRRRWNETVFTNQCS